jgi:hypothetical protein
MLETVCNHRYRVPEVKILRCETGNQLHQDWMDALKKEVPNPDLVYTAMQAYFVHKNGGKRKIACETCRFINTK